MPLHFEMINGVRPSGRTFSSCSGGNPTKVAGTDVTRTFADNLRLALQAVSRNERFIHGQIFFPQASLTKKATSGDRSKSLSNKSDVHLQNVREVTANSGVFCARIHSSMRFWAKRVVVADAKMVT